MWTIKSYRDQDLIGNSLLVLFFLLFFNAIITKLRTLPQALILSLLFKVLKEMTQTEVPRVLELQSSEKDGLIKSLMQYSPWGWKKNIYICQFQRAIINWVRGHLKQQGQYFHPVWNYKIKPCWWTEIRSFIFLKKKKKRGEQKYAVESQKPRKRKAKETDQFT